MDNNRTKNQKLEKDLLEFTGTNIGVCLNSQTAAAEMTLRVLGIGEGDEVITSAYTYTATASVVEHVGAKLVLVDTQEENLEMDYEKLKEAINEKTKVIIPIDLGGVPCDYDKIFEIVEEKKNLFKANNEIQEAYNRVIVMSDAAHALGAEYKEKSRISSRFFKFFLPCSKKFHNSRRWICNMERQRRNRQRKTLQKISIIIPSWSIKRCPKQNKAWLMGIWYSRTLVQMQYDRRISRNRTCPSKKISITFKRRKEIIEKYDKAFRPLGIESLNHFDQNHKSSGHLYITQVPGIDTEQRNKIIEEMAEKGIACNVHYKPLPLLTAYKNLGFDIKDYPNAYNHYKNEITLPLHTKLTDEEVDYIIENYRFITNKYIKR